MLGFAAFFGEGGALVDEELEPTEKLGEIPALLDEPEMKYEVHYHDEGEYSYCSGIPFLTRPQ